MEKYKRTSISLVSNSFYGNKRNILINAPVAAVREQGLLFTKSIRKYISHPCERLPQIKNKQFFFSIEAFRDFRE